MLVSPYNLKIIILNNIITSVLDSILLSCLNYNYIINILGTLIAGIIKIFKIRLNI